MKTMLLTLAVQGAVVKKSCGVMCDRMAARVCGSDGITYSSKCMMKMAACESEKDVSVVHSGPCEPKCPKYCNRMYSPVCATNGKTYDNECELRKKACHSDDDIQLAHDGKCPTGKGKRQNKNSRIQNH